ncbi:hypothetical protein TEA_002024 [Camellia sinensis var. sinensis]|uniref:Aminoacyl-tRNA synthetase class II (D/K/N) domain-containing protein n=1 Tax=Camellia sinensis var. sinensis TaxID=542762 RepID=A0A4S4CZ07_CAMSN|nr:hypothetical protein TEA_002024 [Camellia sinensis var. sinensis]
MSMLIDSQVEIQVKTLYYISKAVPALPINIEDVACGEIEIEKALQIFRQFLLADGFVGIHTPKAEDSHTHRHLCEFTGLDVEMEIKEHYSEVMDIVDRLFVAMFDSLNEKCQKELEDIGKQYPFEPLKEAGVEIDPLGDLNTESERKLGQLVLEKYGTEFYILHRYPLAVRPFYTMPCSDDPAYSNSFDDMDPAIQLSQNNPSTMAPSPKSAEECLKGEGPVNLQTMDVEN